ncbi:hypothetical protein, partial [Prosthecobacter sp.]|uniref:hypothetical protein n=1 Tax=Prosthecobacter sp. TaxID=1965333 RepID=UPI002489958C
MPAQQKQLPALPCGQAADREIVFLTFPPSTALFERMKNKFNPWLMAILGVALLLRIIYWSEVLLGRDTIGYAIGGLGTWCAHSPGYFGYCFSGWLVNQVVANINDSLVLINVVTSLLGIFFCHRLAESFGLSQRNA